MSSLKRLKNRVEAFYQDHNRYPKVRISRDFWENNSTGIAELSSKGINIKVDDSIILKNTFLIEFVDTSMMGVDTLGDLKAHVDKLVAEGKGDWPVRHLHDDIDMYTRVHPYSIVPGEAPHEGLEPDDDYLNCPEGEHILLQLGQ